jgi:hypothetical protein
VSEAGGEHQTIVGQGRERDAVEFDGGAEGGHDSGAGDGPVGSDGQGVVWFASWFASCVPVADPHTHGMLA